MRRRNSRGISVRVDKLTHSIEDAQTGERFETTVERIHPEGANEIKKSQWLFDWKRELLLLEREVFKLCRVGEPKVIQGLVSLEDRGDHVFVYLVENAKFNRGKRKKFIGVAGNLFAFACKKSLENGYSGNVAFDSKTKLIEHYKTSLGAIHVRGQRLFLDEKIAHVLISKYFKA